MPILINFSHPLTPAQLARVGELAGAPVGRVVDVTTQLDLHAPLAPQVRDLVDRAGLSSSEWQTERVIIQPPSLGPIACLLVAELHGRMGYFPTLLRMRPSPGAVAPTFEPAELLPLQAVRDSARTRR
jgi:hypothetical protein